MDLTQQNVGGRCVAEAFERGIVDFSGQQVNLGVADIGKIRAMRQVVADMLHPFWNSAAA